MIVAPDGTQLTVTVPAGSGTVDVTLTTPLGTSPVTTADWFTYKSAKEGKDKEKDRKEGKEKEKDRKEGKEKDLEKGDLLDKTHEIAEAVVQSISQPAGPGTLEGGPATGRAFIAPEERPVVGRDALQDSGQENP